MVEVIENFIVNIFGGNSFLATFFISMIPIIELKGAVPFGMSSQIFGSNALSPFSAWIAASVGSLIPALFLVWLFIPIMIKLKSAKLFKALTSKIEEKFKNNAEKIKNNAKKSKNMFWKKFLGLMIFVAIPVPLTGAYTGSAIAGYLGIGYLNSILSIFLGNIIAGGIVVLLCTIFKGYEGLIFICFLVVLLLILGWKVINYFIKNKKTKTIKN